MNLSPEQAAWAYRLAVAIAGLMVTYGLVSESEVAAWLEVVGAFVGIGGAALAARRTPRPTRRQKVDTSGWVDAPGTDTGIPPEGPQTPTEPYDRGWREDNP